MKIQDISKTNMKTTPYQENGKDSSFSKARTSKVKYLNEFKCKEALMLSKRLELVTRLNSYKELFASENYQVMNYGIGGKISQHFDSRGEIFDTDNPFNKMPLHASERLDFGGLRLMTWMIYLSDVQVGGNTVFPQAEISIRPSMGSVLYWFNIGASNNMDSRVRHLGCPVGFGNKWIANKWIKWLSNFRTFPCLTAKKHYSILK